MISGIDVSKWQDNNATPQQIDFTKAAGAGAKFVYIRAALGASMDEDFKYNWQAAGNAGLLRGFYFAPKFEQQQLPQVNLWRSLIQGYPCELPPALDVERVNLGKIEAGNAVPAIKYYLDTIEAVVGRKPVFYTNPDLLKNYLKPFPAWLVQYDLWIALYGTLAAANIKPFLQWRLWQYTDKGNGAAYGAESAQIDLDYYNGTENEMRAWAGLPLVDTVEDRLEKLEAWAVTLGYKK